MIAEEAGCVVTQIDGAPLDLLAKSSVLGGSPMAYRALRSLFEEIGEKEP